VDDKTIKSALVEVWAAVMQAHSERFFDSLGMHATVSRDYWRGEVVKAMDKVLADDEDAYELVPVLQWGNGPLTSVRVLKNAPAIKGGAPAGAVLTPLGWVLDGRVYDVDGGQ